MLGNKKFYLAVATLLIAMGGGAYLYYVYLPQLQDETLAANRDAMKSAKKPVSVTPPVAQGLSATSSVVAASAVSASANPAPASGTLAALPQTPAPALPASATPPVTEMSAEVPQSGIPQTGGSASAATTTPEAVQAVPGAQKSASKKSGKKSRSAPVIEPMDSKSRVNAESAPPTLRLAPEPVSPPTPKTPAEPSPAVAFAPDTESKVIRPKYNDVMTAVLRGDSLAVKQLLDLGWWVDKPGADGYTPLVAAAMNRDTHMVRLLLDHGAIPSSQALKAARDRKDADTASLLEQRGAR